MPWKIDKVKKLIDLLENLELSEKRVFNLRKFKEFYACSTTACALGWYSIKYPEELNIIGCGFNYEAILNCFIENETYDEETLFDAIFGMNIKQSLLLYENEFLSDITKEQVIQQLRKLI